MSGPEDTTPVSSAEPSYMLKPPLWRPARERRRSAITILLGGLAMVVMGAVASFPVVEKAFLSTPAHATPVTITAIENASHADEETPMYFHYVVTLPDGSSGRFASQTPHRPGEHLMAMVSRGRLTGRIIVSAPYVALERE